MTVEAEAALAAKPPVLREIADLPGPRGWPLVGNLFQIDKPRMHAQVEDWVREYGPFLRFRLGSRPMLVVADHAAMAAVLRDRPDGFRRTPRLEQVGNELGLAGGVFGAEGDRWRRQRRMVMAGFDPRHLKAYFPALVKVTGRLEGRWRRAARAGATIDLQSDLMRFTVDAISGLAFGSEINTLESDEEVIQRHLDKIFPAMFDRLLAPLPTWRWWKSAAVRDLDRSVAAVNTAIEGFIAQARTRLDAEPGRREAPANLLEAMLVAAGDEHSGITDREVAGNVMTMLLAGEDTTANSLAWMIWLLHENPDCLARARAEIDECAGPMAGWTPERLAGLAYVGACASETMRLKPVAPSIVLQALRDTTIADIRVPRGTLVWGALRSDSLDERHFPDAMRFDPDRWLHDDPQRSAAAAARIAMPFGAGPRVCPGRHLALQEMTMVLAMLLHRFELESVATADGDPPKENLSFTMAPVGLGMRLRERP
ncbi:MAG: cytochrome P450 [Caldimonas sp.]